MPGGMQPEPSGSGRGKSKAPQVPTRTSSHIPRLSATIRAIQRGEGTTGKEYERPPGPGESSLYHPDWPGHRTTGALAADFTSYDFAYLADSEDTFEATLAESQNDPISLIQARSCTDWPKWREAMDREIATLQEAGTWISVP